MNKNKNIITAGAAGFVVGLTTAFGVATVSSEQAISATDLSAMLNTMEQPAAVDENVDRSFYEERLREKIESMQQQNEEMQRKEQEKQNIVTQCFSDDPQEFRACILEMKDAQQRKNNVKPEPSAKYRANPHRVDLRTEHEDEMQFVPQIEEPDFNYQDEEVHRKAKVQKLQEESFNLWNSKREYEEQFKHSVREEAEYRLEVIKRCQKEYPGDFRNCFHENIDMPNFQPAVEEPLPEANRPQQKPTPTRARINNTDLPLRELVKLCLKEDPTNLRECVKESVKNVYRPDVEFDSPDEIGTMPDDVDEGESFKVRRDHSQESI